MFKAYASLMIGAFAATLAVMGFVRADFAMGQSQGGAPAPRANAEPVLVELFTSQGCSSCPPADVLAEQLSKRGDLVVISRPVTYWDRLGWKDTLALPSNTDLQRNYAARRLVGRNGVYTPQMVLDGSSGAVGSRAGQVERLINQASHNQTAAIRSRRLDNGNYRIALGGRTSPSGTAGAPATLSLIGLSTQSSVAIGRGENAGRQVRYTNVVRGEREIARWNGGAETVDIAAGDLRIAGADRYALVLRSTKSNSAGQVLAARYLDDTI